MRNLYKTANGHIRVKADVENGTILDIRITGSFLMIPEDALWLLERHLNGVEMDRDMVGKAVDVFYMLGIETPMISRDEIVDAIVGAKDEAQAYRAGVS